MEDLVWIGLGGLLLWMAVRHFLMVRRRISGPAAREKVREGALLLDVRSPGEFAADHIEGAVNIPVDRLETRLEGVSKDRPVVVYCRSGARSYAASRLLSRHGYEVHDLGPRHAWG